VSAKALGIEPLPESRRPGEVGKEDGDELSLLLRGGGAVETMTARNAELGAHPRLRAAGRAGLHQCLPA
jgi:hypothetical protein